MRLAGRRIGGRCFGDAKKLVVEHPICLDVVMRGLPHHLALDFPRTGQLIHKVVRPRRRSSTGQRQTKERTKRR
jgi:hypothetical protein